MASTTPEDAMVEAKAAREAQADPYTNADGTVNTDAVLSAFSGFGMRVDLDGALRAGLTPDILKAVATALPGIIAKGTGKPPGEILQFSEINKGFVRQQSTNRIVTALESTPDGRAALAAKRQKGGK